MTTARGSSPSGSRKLVRIPGDLPVEEARYFGLTAVEIVSYESWRVSGSSSATEIL